MDIEHFDALRAGRSIEGCPFNGQSTWLIGTVGRMQVVKDQTLLARAFVRALNLRQACETGCAWSWSATARCALTARPSSMPQASATWPGFRAAQRRGRCHARLDCLRAALAGRGHLQYHPGGHGHGLARDRHRRGRQCRTGEHGPHGRDRPIDRTSTRWRTRSHGWPSAPADRGSHGAAGRARGANAGSACRPWWRPTRTSTTGNSRAPAFDRRKH